MSRKKICLLLFFVIILLISGTLVIINIPFPHLTRPEKIGTLNDLYENKITNFVGRKIFLKTRLRVRNPQLTVFNTDQRLYDLMTDRFIYNTDDKIKRFNFSITSNKLREIKIPIPEMLSLLLFNEIPPLHLLRAYNLRFYYKPVYFFGTKLIQNYDRIFILEGTLKYRESNITSQVLQDEKFIKQSNNPAYWSHTFKFEVSNIYSAD